MSRRFHSQSDNNGSGVRQSDLPSNGGTRSRMGALQRRKQEDAAKEAVSTLLSRLKPVKEDHK
jgi:hypothetical protein